MTRQDIGDNPHGLLVIDGSFNHCHSHLEGTESRFVRGANNKTRERIDIIHTYLHTYILTLHDIALHCITLHYITLRMHYITLHYTTLH